MTAPCEPYCAVIYGATGAVGAELLHLCLEDSKYSTVVVLARKPTKLEHPKLIWLTSTDGWERAVSKHARVNAYCCIGTTLKQAGSREAFRKVDYDLIVEFASRCRKLEVEYFGVISALGANARSRNLYNRTKGEMENALIQLEFKSLSIFRPSLLDAKRIEFRTGERIATLLLNIASPLLFGSLRNLKPITPAKVASAMRADCRSASTRVSFINNLDMHSRLD